MKNKWLAEITLSLFPVLLLGQSQLQAVLEHFNSALRTGNNGPLPSLYTGEDPGQTANIVANQWVVAGAATGCGNPLGCGIYWHWIPGPSYAFSAPCTSLSCGYTQAGLRSGTWSVNYNRLGIKFKCNKNISANGDGGYNHNIGTYIRDHEDGDSNNQGRHFYHLINMNVYVDEWAWLEISNHPQYEIGQPSSTNHPNDPAFAAQGEHYLDALTRWYWDTQWEGWEDITCTFDDIGFWEDTGKAPEEYVSSVSLIYSGSLYSLAWAGIKNQAVTYDVRHSTAGALRSVGWSNGTSDGTSNATQSDYDGVLKNVTMARASGTIYFGIRPRMNVASVSAGPPIQINTGVGHSLVTGMDVSVASVCANANGARVVTVVDRDSVTLDGTSGACSYSSGGTITTTSETDGFYQIQLGEASGAMSRGVTGRVVVNGRVQ